MSLIKLAEESDQKDQTIKPYIPASKNPFSFKVSTPTNMSFEIKQALAHLKRMYGDVDAFVQSKLAYENKEELYKHLGAEQIDGIALTIHQIEQGNGLIIGDQTGIGKGRQAAAIIRYAVVNGIKCVFITEKSNLFSDLYRDLMDIGYAEAVPFITNEDPEARLVVEVEEGGKKKVVRMEDYTGNRKYALKGKDRQIELLAGRNDLPKGYDFLMTTYTQLSADNWAKKMRADANPFMKYKPSDNSQHKTQFLREYAKGAIFVMDEAHNAGGSESNTGFYIREILETAQGCCYLSATYAKRSDNLPVYAIKTSIREAKLSNEDMITTFARGGVAMQEIVASDLVTSGQMIRRQRTFQGIKIEYNYLKEKYPDHIKVVDSVTEIVRDIIQFQKKHIYKAIDDMSEAMGLTGEGAGATTTSGTSQAGLQNAAYFNKIHHIIDQVLFSLKALDVAMETVELLKQDKKVVIAFKSTMGSFLEEQGYVDGDAVESQDFGLILEKGLKGVMKYTEKSGRGKATPKVIPFEDLTPEGQADYLFIMDKIAAASTNISISPIDVLINYIEAQRRPSYIGGVDAPYFRVRECTGRKGQIKIEDGVAVYRSFKANKKEFFRQFNNGTADVLLINQSASTGVSCHASAKYDDKRKRVMIIHQAELNINTEIQKRGRINRTGQVEVLNGKENMPEYLYMSTSIPSERRMFMVLKRKLKSLDANTTGSQRSSEGQLQVEDFFNKYGAKVIEDLLKNDKALNTQLGNPLKFEVEGAKKVPVGKIPEKVTRAISIQPVAMQEKFYTTVMERYKTLVDDLKRTGEYDLEVDFLDYQAQTIKRGMFVPGTGGVSPFAKDSIIETVKAKVLKKPYKLSHIQKLIGEYLGGMVAKEKQEELLSDLERKYDFYANHDLKRKKEKVAERKEEIELLEDDLYLAKAKPEPEKKKEKTKWANAIKKIEGLIETRERYLKGDIEALEAREASVIANKENIKNFGIFQK